MNVPDPRTYHDYAPTPVGIPAGTRVLQTASPDVKEGAAGRVQGLGDQTGAPLVEFRAGRAVAAVGTRGSSGWASRNLRPTATPRGGQRRHRTPASKEKPGLWAEPGLRQRPRGPVRPLHPGASRLGRSIRRVPRQNPAFRHRRARLSCGGPGGEPSSEKTRLPHPSSSSGGENNPPSLPLTRPEAWGDSLLSFLLVSSL